jgi:hypothetical protein
MRSGQCLPCTVYMYMLHLSIAISLDVGGRPMSLGLVLPDDSCSRPKIPFLRVVAFLGPHIPIKASLVRSCPRRQESLRGLYCGIRNITLEHITRNTLVAAYESREACGSGLAPASPPRHGMFVPPDYRSQKVLATIELGSRSLYRET